MVNVYMCMLNDQHSLLFESRGGGATPKMQGWGTNSIESRDAGLTREFRS